MATKHWKQTNNKIAIVGNATTGKRGKHKQIQKTTKYAKQPRNVKHNQERKYNQKQRNPTTHRKCNTAKYWKTTCWFFQWKAGIHTFRTLTWRHKVLRWMNELAEWMCSESRVPAGDDFQPVQSRWRSGRVFQHKSSATVCNEAASVRQEDDPLGTGETDLPFNQHRTSNCIYIAHIHK